MLILQVKKRKKEGKKKRKKGPRNKLFAEELT